jgi:hypothetical protein
VENVEALAIEDAAEATREPRREHDVRQRAVGGDDHGASDRDDVIRWVAVTPVARVERARERPGRVVADDGARLDADPAKCIRLELRVLVYPSDEGPREGDDDPDLHGSKSMIQSRSGPQVGLRAVTRHRRSCEVTLRR